MRMGVQDRDWFWDGRDGRIDRADAQTISVGAEPVSILNVPLAIACVSVVLVAAFWRFVMYAPDAVHPQQPAVPVAPVVPVPRVDSTQGPFVVRGSAATAVEKLRAPVALSRQETDPKAWARYYVMPDYCKVDWSMKCANQYIRARREFDALARGPSR
jgi:hypothetical protein